VSVLPVRDTDEALRVFSAISVICGGDSLQIVLPIDGRTLGAREVLSLPRSLVEGVEEEGLGILG